MTTELKCCEELLAEFRSKQQKIWNDMRKDVEEFNFAEMHRLKSETTELSNKRTYLVRFLDDSKAVVEIESTQLTQIETYIFYTGAGVEKLFNQFKQKV